MNEQESTAVVDWLHLELPTGLQLWRVHWLAHWMSMAALATLSATGLGLLTSLVVEAGSAIGSTLTPGSLLTIGGVAAGGA